MLLVHPLGHLWFDSQGQALAHMPDPSCPVVVIADVIEETHVEIDVPAIGGQDRRSFIQLQLATLLPDTLFRAIWEQESSWPLLAKQFVLHATGLGSTTLKEAVDEQLQQQRPIVGVWSLSHLMARWGAVQAHTKEAPWLVLVWGQGYGLRMVLLNNGVPLFSRLLLDSTDHANGVRETLKYLQDNRMLAREVNPPIAVLYASDEAVLAMRQQGLHVLHSPKVSDSTAGEVWPTLVQLAQRRAPGQMASVWERRFYVAQHTRLGLHLGGAALACALLWGTYQQAQAVWGRHRHTHESLTQSVQKRQQAQAIQQSITASGVDTGLMRLAIAVKQQELDNGIQLMSPLWHLASWLATQPHIQLNKVTFSVQTQLCGANDASAPPIPDPSGGTHGVPTQWQFEMTPHDSTSPRERQRLLELTARTVQSWSNWRVRTDPVPEAAIAPIAVAQAGAAPPPTTWVWCLSSTAHTSP